MKAQIRCLLSAILVVLLSIGIVFLGVNSEEKTKTIDLAKTAVQSEAVVRDYIHDNYVISEKNPWTDYSLKPIEYKESNQEINKTVGAKSAILVDVFFAEKTPASRKKSAQSPLTNRFPCAIISVFEAEACPSLTLRGVCCRVHRLFPFQAD